jgi:hypothetical protein
MVTDTDGEVSGRVVTLWTNKRTARFQGGLGGKVRAMVKVDIRSMVFAMTPT